MKKLFVLAILLFVMALGYSVHMLIKKFVDPKRSLNHLFLFFLAHFVAIFTLAFLVNFFIMKFSKFLFQA